MKTKNVSRLVLSLTTASMLVSGCGSKTEATCADTACGIACCGSDKTAPCAVGKLQSVPVGNPDHPGVSVLIDKAIKVMTADVDALASSVFEANRMMIPDEQAEAARRDIRKNVIDQLTVQEILLRECDQAEITVTDEERDAFFTRVTGGETTLEEAAQASGMTVDRFHKMLATSLRIEKLLKGKAEALPEVTEADARARFDDVVAANPEAAIRQGGVSASHILFQSDDGDAEADAAAQAKAADIRQQLLDGADFEALAMAHSSCPSKQNGGSLGQFGRGQMVKPFEDAAFSQAVGEIGEVVKTQFGYHIIRVDEKTEEGQIAFEDVKDMIMESLEQERMRTFQQDYIGGLRQAAQIENFEKAVFSDPIPAAPRELPGWAE